MTEAGSGSGVPGGTKGRSCLRFAAKLFLFGIVFLGLAGVAAGLGAFLVYEHIRGPGVAGESVAFSVPQGATGTEVGGLLAKEGFIDHEVFFRIALRLDGSGKAIKHGTYALPKGLSPLQLLRVLHGGPDYRLGTSALADELKVTVPEGLTIAQAARLFDDPNAFVAAASRPGLIGRLDVEVASLEGFLMPNTYFFAGKPTEADVVERMLSQFENDYAALRSEFPDPGETDTLRLVTIASLVEEESRVDEERPLVAAVIYNRLARNMPLEMDATLQYALGKYGQRILAEDKEADSPYNTYTNRGLPPGPISSPGVASLRAAMAPADVDYLYFVSNADGETHTFSRTLREHNRAVARYRKEISKQRRERRTSP